MQGRSDVFNVCCGLKCVRIVSRNYCFQLATDITASDSDEEEDDDEDDEEEEKMRQRSQRRRSPKSLKRAAAAKKAEPKAAEGAGPSTGGRPKRQRKQVEKD